MVLTRISAAAQLGAMIEKITEYTRELMERTGIISIVAGVLVVGIVFVYLFRRLRRLRAKRRMRELLSGYFRGGMPADQLGRRTREMADHFTRTAEFQALAIVAFQGAAEAKLVRQPHSMEDESELLRLLAALKNEFGLPDRYQIEAWRPGRE